MDKATQNTLELARQGDPGAIAVILTYHLSQRWNTSASAIRLGNYLSVLIDVSYAIPQARLVQLVLDILRDLDIQGITVIEINARQTDDPEVQWSQTIELDSPTPLTTMTDAPSADLTPAAPLDLTTAERSPAPEPASDTWEPSLYAFLQRPELVALLAFAIVLVLWDSYLEWMGEIDTSQPLTGVKLARRLGVSASTLSKFKYRANFSEWSRDLDPAGIAWSYENKLFVPQLYGYPTGDRELAGLTH